VYARYHNTKENETGIDVGAMLVAL